MGSPAGGSSHTRVSSHRILIFGLIWRITTICHKFADNERSFTSTKLACHRRSFGSTWTIKRGDDVVLLKHAVSQSANTMRVTSTHLFFCTSTLRGRHGCRIDFELVIVGLSFIGSRTACLVPWHPRLVDHSWGASSHASMIYLRHAEC